MDYSKKRWQQKRKHILKLDDYKDRIETRYGRTVGANTVHHIYPVEQFPEYQWQDWNLISVSAETHSKLHDRKSHELTNEGLVLMQRTRPGEDWRKRE